MTIAQELLTLIDAAIKARLEERPVDSYALPNGTNLTYMKVAELWAVRKEIASEVRSTGGPRTIRSVSSTRTWGR